MQYQTFTTIPILFKQASTDSSVFTSEITAALGLTFLQNYGAMAGVLSFLTELETLKFQQVSQWMFRNGVGRVQTSW